MNLRRNFHTFLLIFLTIQLFYPLTYATPSKSPQNSPQSDSTSPNPLEFTSDPPQIYIGSFFSFLVRKSTEAPPKPEKLTVSAEPPASENSQEENLYRNLFGKVNETLLLVTDAAEVMGGDVEVNSECKICMESCMKNQFSTRISTSSGEEVTTEVNNGNSPKEGENRSTIDEFEIGSSLKDVTSTQGYSTSPQTFSNSPQEVSSSPQGFSITDQQESSSSPQFSSISPQFLSISPQSETSPDFTTEITSTSPNSPQDSIDKSNYLREELIKVTEEFHNERVKFNLLHRELTEEQKKSQKLEKLTEKLLFELKQSENEIQSQQKLVKKLRENSEICDQKIDRLSKNLDFVVKILEVERYKDNLEAKLDEFEMREEIEISNSTKVKFLIFELETEDSHVSLVANQQLVTIPSRLADVAPSLSEFSASDCGLQFIDGSSFENLESLKILNLSRNFIAKIENETFGNLANLEVLDLSFNILENLEISAFSGLNNLLNLNLSNNKISSLPPQIFGELENLKILTLSQNLIAELKFQIFPPKNALEEFYVDNNLLSFVEPKVIEALEEALVVNMRNNYCIDHQVPEDGSMLKLGIHVGVNCRAAGVEIE